MIFVFGSNLAGRHGKGAALHARQRFGARPGVGEGLTGRSYAIPTKDAQLRPRSLADIAISVQTFKAFARSRSDLTFQVTKIGCGLAGYTDDQISPMFRDAPDNCELPSGWYRRIFDHHVGAPEDRRFSRAAWEMTRAPTWSSVPTRDEPAPVAGEIERP